MAHIIADRVRDTSTTTGTGALTLSGTASSGFQSFAAAVGVGNTVIYCIEHQTAAQWEVGVGTLTAATTLARTRVLASSNGGAAVNFSAGAKTVFGDLPASYFRQTLGRTNMIINPHGSIQQETTTPVNISITPTAYIADQWALNIGGSGYNFEAGVQTGAVSAHDPSHMYIKTTTTKAVAAGDQLTLIQPMEGLFTRRLLYGTANAKGSWLMFRASATQAATCHVNIRNAGLARSFVQSFAVTTTPNTYAVYVPGDTTGTYPTNNTASHYVGFCFAAGTTFQTATLGAWQAGNFTAGTAQTNLLAALNAQLNITDVMWCASEVPLPFEPIDHAQELVRCQRYYERGHFYVLIPTNISGSANGAWCQFSVSKRGIPTVTQTNTDAFNCSTTPSQRDVALNGFASYRNSTVTGTQNAQFGEDWVAAARI